MPSRVMVLCGLVFLLPLSIGFKTTLDPFNIPKLAVLFVGCGLLLVPMTRATQSRSASLRAFAWPAAWTAIPLVIAWLASPYRGWGVMGQYSSYQGIVPTGALILLGAYVALCDDPQQRALIRALAVSASVVGGYAVAQRFGLDPFDWHLHGTTLPASSTMGNPNHTGSFLAVALPVSFAYVRPRHLATFVPAALVLLGLGAAQSQGAMGAATAAAIVFAGLCLRSRVRWLPMVAGLAALLIALVLVGLIGMSLVDDSFGALHPTIQDRGWDWIAAGGVFLDHPVIGGGPNAYAVEGVRHRVVEASLRDGYGFGIEPHSLPLTIAASTGVVGLIAAGLLVVWIARRMPSGTCANQVQIAWFSAIVGYFVLSLVAADQLSLRLLLFVALGGLAASALERGPEGTLSSASTGSADGPRRRSGLVAIPLALALIVWGVAVAVADSKALAGVVAARQGHYRLALHRLDTAKEVRPDVEYDFLFASTMNRAAATRVLTREAERIRSAWEFVEEFPDIRAYGQFARGLSASEPSVVSTQEEALRWLRRVISIDPANPISRADAALILVVLGRTDEAIDTLDRIAFLQPPWSRYWGAQAIVSVSARQYRVARAQIGIAFELDPGEPLAIEAKRLLVLAKGAKWVEEEEADW